MRISGFLYYIPLVFFMPDTGSTHETLLPPPTRLGKRALMPLDSEIALARTAAPMSVSASATVLVFTDSGFVTGAQGTNGVTCIVNRSWPESLEPHCFDSEATRTILPMELHRTVAYHKGKAEDEVEREIATGLAAGRFTLPVRPAMSYMMSGAQKLVDDDGRPVGRWRPHIMIYSPYLTNKNVGLAAVPDMSVGMVADEGKPGANIMIIMRDFTGAQPAK